MDLEQPATLAVMVDDRLVPQILWIRFPDARSECPISRLVHLDFLLVYCILDLFIDEDLVDDGGVKNKLLEHA